VKKGWSPFNTKRQRLRRIAPRALMLSNLTVRTSGALHPRTEIIMNDIAVVGDSVIRNTIHGRIGIWDAAAMIKQRHTQGTLKPRGVEATQTDNAKYQRETVGIWITEHKAPHRMRSQIDDTKAHKQRATQSGKHVNR
jgi:hypothetical protein